VAVFAMISDMQLSAKERALLLVLQYTCPTAGYARENYEIMAAGDALFGEGWIGMAEVRPCTMNGIDCTFHRLHSPELNMTLGRLTKRGLITQHFQDDRGRCEWSPNKTGDALVASLVSATDRPVALQAANTVC
jgi:hypothetical protein